MVPCVFSKGSLNLSGEAGLAQLAAEHWPRQPKWPSSHPQGAAGAHRQGKAGSGVLQDRVTCRTGLPGASSTGGALSLLPPQVENSWGKTTGKNNGKEEKGGKLLKSSRDKYESIIPKSRCDVKLHEHIRHLHCSKIMLRS